MADLPQQDTINQYLAGGAQSSFVVDFFVPLESDGEPNLDVYVTPSGQTPIPESDIKVWGVDFTYTSNIDPITGGTVNFLPSSVPAFGDVVTLVRDVQASLDVEFSNAQTFNGANLDDALDKLLLIEQQNKTYALQRNLSYVVNSYLPDATRTANVQIPLLEAQQVWMGSADGVIAATLEQNPDVSTLRSELANDSPGTDGARIVGYYDTVNLTPTTVDAMLTALNTSGFRIINKQKLTVGSGTYTPTTGTKYCWARAVAGGGGGGGCLSFGGQCGVGGGGGAGGYAEAIFAAASLAYSVGAGGLAGSGGTAGTAGGATTLGSVISVGGGNPGQPANSQPTAAFGQAGTGGSVTSGDLALEGQSGGIGWADSTIGGVSGYGAASFLGAGGISKGGGSPLNGGNAPTNGFGAGGSGGICFAVSSAIGGAGSPGVIEIYEFG